MLRHITHSRHHVSVNLSNQRVSAGLRARRCCTRTAPARVSRHQHLRHAPQLRQLVLLSWKSSCSCRLEAVLYTGIIYRYYIQVSYTCIIYRYYIQVLYAGIIYRYYIQVSYIGCVLYTGIICRYYIQVLYTGIICRYYIQVLYTGIICRYYKQVLYTGIIGKYV